MKKIAGVTRSRERHWVGDGFPVRTLFSYGAMSSEVSPFLLLDYGGPHVFEPSRDPRGVGQHPHRGFETVTIVYEGEVAHRDSAGNGGVIGPGDVQWMTAAGGIIHEEFHSPAFTKSGGRFRMVQLWVNLPATHKMKPPGYQPILSSDIPTIQFPDHAGSVRIIAGDFGGTKGPARTATPVNVWDTNLKSGAGTTLALPEGHNAMLVVLSGRVRINGAQPAEEAEVIRIERDGSEVRVDAASDAHLLVLTGEPIDEPVVGYGPFVMNSEQEIRQAITDFNSGRFGEMSANSA